MRKKHSGGNGYFMNCNPDPTRFEIIKWSCNGEYTVVFAQYKGCTNREGLKVLVYKADIAAVLEQKALDPHFGEEGFFPIARFEPTQEGYLDAIDYAERKAGFRRTP